MTFKVGSRLRYQDRRLCSGAQTVVGMMQDGLILQCGSCVTGDTENGDPMPYVYIMCMDEIPIYLEKIQ